MRNLEHPDISRALVTGYGTKIDDIELICPVCGEILEINDTVYKQDGEVIGCKCCVTEAEAGDVL